MYMSALNRHYGQEDVLWSTACICTRSNFVVPALPTSTGKARCMKTVGLASLHYPRTLHSAANARHAHQNNISRRITPQISMPIRPTARAVHFPQRVSTSVLVAFCFFAPSVLSCRLSYWRSVMVVSFSRDATLSLKSQMPSNASMSCVP